VKRNGKKPFRCLHAKKARVLIFGKNGEAYCRPCWEFLGNPTGLQSSHVHTGRKCWTGLEVYGNKLGSDELRADTERDLLKKNWPPWMEQRIKNKGLDESRIRTRTEA
jgi:hypothetical protein